MKICTKCRVAKDEAEFSKKNGGLNCNCRQCVSDRYKAWYEKNKEKESARAKANKHLSVDRNRSLLLDYLLTNPCDTCGETDPIVLQFHHLRDKDHSVSEMVNTSFSWERIKEEIDKCQVLCSNCHDRVTAIEVNSWKIAALAQSGRALVL